MLKRLITGIILLLILVPALIYYDTLATPALWALIASVSVYETAKCVGLTDKKQIPLTWTACAVSVVLPFLQYFIGIYSERTEFILAAPIILSVAFLAVFIIYAGGTFGFIKSKQSPKSRLLTMLVYTSAASVSAVAISQTEHGGFILPLLFFGSWMTDIFAYVCGSLFGKHKLIPSVSPKKTVEGSVGGTVFAALFSILYGYIVMRAANMTVSYVPLFVSVVILSVISQIGDLNASYIKREYGIKDYGQLFPGHGGMLDRFDSVIASAPFLFALSMIFSYFA